MKAFHGLSTMFEKFSFHRHSFDTVVTRESEELFGNNRVPYHLLVVIDENSPII